MNENVLVTGASSGIGAATASHLATRGFRVFGSSRNPSGLLKKPPGIEWVTMDVRDEASVQAAITEVLDRSGGLDALVCNAGIGIFGSVEEVSLEEARAQFETNFFGVLCCLRAILPGMRERGRGRVVLVGSLAGRAPIPFQAHYSASKAAVDALALALRNELHGTGVSVSLVEPGDVQTAFNEATDFSATARSAYSPRIERCRQVVEESLPRAPGPEAVARAIHRALRARRPRVRYPVGPDSWLVPISRRWLPDWLCLELIRSHFKV